MKFSEIIEPFLSYKNDYVRKSTMSQYASVFVNHLVPYFGELEDILQSDVDKYLYYKSQSSYSKKALQSHIVPLKSILNWANKTGIYYTKPFRANYPSGALEPKDINPLSIADARAFAKYCEGNFTFLNLALYTALCTGLRAAEICGLQWKDVDIERGIISVNKIAVRVEKNVLVRGEGNITEVLIGPPKTPNSVREIPLTKQLLSVYKPLLKIVNQDWFIASNSIKPCEPKMLRNALDDILKNAELPRIRMHDLRHTFATRCISSGVDAKTVSIMLGHSTVNTTLKIYMHTDDESKTIAMNKLSKKIA